MVIIDYKKLLKKHTGPNGNLNEQNFTKAVKKAGGTRNDAIKAINLSLIHI